MNKICTSIEQSQKLIELGIDVSTVDMYYGYDYNSPIGGYEEDAQIIPQSESDQHFSLFLEDIPAWSLSALLGLMPFQIIENNKRYGFCGWKGYNSQGETYCFEYDTNIGPCLTETYYWNDPIDAAFEMVCWLLENKKI